jgi:hypothetical protein
MGVSLITGMVGIGRRLGVLAQLEDDDAQPIDGWQVGFWQDGSWHAELVLDFKPVALSPFGTDPGRWVVLGMEGEVLWLDNVGAPSQRERRDQIGDGSLPAFTTLAPFGSGIAATGMGRAVYWSNGAGWRTLGAGLLPDQPAELVGFEALAAIDDEFYACGWRGEIWYLVEGVWRQAHVPTNVILTGAAASQSNDVIVCGRLGTLLRGRRERWAMIDHQQTEEDFWSTATFQDSVYISSMLAIYELSDGHLAPVDDGSTAGSYYHLSANEQIIASIGATAVLVGDGEDWQQIL